MTRSSLARRAASVALALALVAALSIVVAAPVGAGGSALVGAPITVPKGGTSAGAAALNFWETSADEFPSGSFTVEVSIQDATGIGNHLSFVETSKPTLDKPDTLAATVDWSGTTASSFKVTATSSSTSRIETFTVGNLRVKADASAAPGPIVVTYSSSIIFSATVMASGWLTAQANSGASALSIVMDPGSPLFKATATGYGELSITNASGTRRESRPVSSTPAPTSTSITLTENLTFTHFIGEAVTQEQMITNRLPPIGTVPGTATGLSIAASSTPSVVRGVADQVAGNVTITETTGHPLLATQVIHFSVANDSGLGTPGATFSATPVVSANTSSSGILATIQNWTSSGFDVRIGTAASGSTGGVLTISNIRLTVNAAAALGALQLVILSTNGSVPFNQLLTDATVVASAPLTLSLTPSTTAPPVNGPVTLRAQTSVAVAGLSIVFQAKPAGALVFTTIGTVLTSASGTADLIVMVPLNTLYKAVFAGNASYNAAESSQVAVSPVRSLSLQIAAGYKTSLTSGYGTAVSVPNGTYATLRAVLGAPVAANEPVEFWQRIDKTGAWTFLSTGRTDASGVVVWSKVVKVPASATGYGRYVYFKVVVAGTASYGMSVSNAVRAVAK